MQNSYPQKRGIDSILKEAFYYWNKTLIYQFLFSCISFFVLGTCFYILSQYYGVWGQFLDVSQQMKQGMEAYSLAIAKMAESANFRYFHLWMTGVFCFLYPLNLGFYQIYRKMDKNENISLSDLFSGYNGSNFFRYASYFLFWNIIYSYAFSTIILGIVWVMITLFVAPLMFFMDKRIFEAISLNIKALKLYFLEISVAVIVALAFKYVGFLLFFVGALFTYPFWNAIIYTLYKTIFVEKD